MCSFKSAIILKDRVFVPDYDHHTQMLEELKINDDYFNSSKVFVRAELLPKDGNIFSDIDTWRFVVDQDITPDRFCREVAEARMKEAVKAWAVEHIHKDKSGFELTKGIHYLKNCRAVYAYDSSTVKAYGSSTVEACGSSTVYAYGSSTVEAYDSSTVYAYGSSTVEACGSSTVRAYGKSTVVANGSSTVEANGSSTVRAYGNSAVEAYHKSTVVANGSSTVEAYGNSTVEACGSSTVEACGSSTVKACHSSTVKAYGNSTVVAYGSSTVLISEHSSNSRDNISLMDNSMLKDCKTKTLYQAGEWKSVRV